MGAVLPPEPGCVPGRMRILKSNALPENEHRPDRPVSLYACEKKKSNSACGLREGLSVCGNLLKKDCQLGAFFYFPKDVIWCIIFIGTRCGCGRLCIHNI